MSSVTSVRSVAGSCLETRTSRALARSSWTSLLPGGSGPGGLGNRHPRTRSSADHGWVIPGLQLAARPDLPAGPRRVAGRVSDRHACSRRTAVPRGQAPRTGPLDRWVRSGANRLAPVINKPGWVGLAAGLFALAAFWWRHSPPADQLCQTLQDRNVLVRLQAAPGMSLTEMNRMHISPGRRDPHRARRGIGRRPRRPRHHR